MELYSSNRRTKRVKQNENWKENEKKRIRNENENENENEHESGVTKLNFDWFILLSKLSCEIKGKQNSKGNSLQFTDEINVVFKLSVKVIDRVAYIGVG